MKISKSTNALRVISTSTALAPERAAAPRTPVEGLAPAQPRQLVTLDGRAQPRSSDDVYLAGSGPGWVDPMAAPAHARAAVATYSGPLFRDGATPADVQQGQLGNCYFAAALAGIAATQPDAIARLVRPGPDGAADVTFHERDVVTGELRPVVLHVDAELYESSGKPLYGHARGDRQSMELWFPLVEKAYATWRGGYDVVGQGGVQNAVFETVLGRPAGWLAIDGAGNADGVWGTILATVNAGLPIGAATHGVDDGRYANSGVYANHGYTLLGAEEVGGQRFVTLRNPWGSGEPRGDGVDDGVFTLPFERFLQLYGQLQFVLT